MASGINIRQATVAGSFYPEKKQELNSLLENLFGNTQKIPDLKNIKALITPHAGFIYSGQTAAWGYRQLPQNENLHYVLIGPSHHYSFLNLVGSSFSFWETPMGIVKQISKKILMIR